LILHLLIDIFLYLSLRSCAGGIDLEMTATRFAFIQEVGAQKTPPRVALTNSWEYASAGAALGATHPDVVRGMFERTHKKYSEKGWRTAYVAGLDIGPEQPSTSYAEAEATENKNFMEFCQQFRPDLYAILKN
jgi:hypothetical protein